MIAPLSELRARAERLTPAGRRRAALNPPPLVPPSYPVRTYIDNSDLLALVEIAEAASNLSVALSEWGGSDAIAPFVERLDDALEGVVRCMDGTPA